MTLEDMRAVEPETVDRSTLVQRDSIRINADAPQEERMRQYIDQIKNPYCYLDGKTVVKICFAETDCTIEECIGNYLSGI